MKSAEVRIAAKSTACPELPMRDLECLSRCESELKWQQWPYSVCRDTISIKAWTVRERIVEQLLRATDYQFALPRAGIPPSAQ